MKCLFFPSTTCFGDENQVTLSAIGCAGVVKSRETPFDLIQSFNHVWSSETKVTLADRGRVTLSCTKFAQNFHEFSSSLSSSLHNPMLCWVQGTRQCTVDLISVQRCSVSLTIT